MSGWATRRPSGSTTYAYPALPILIRETTSQMALRLTSATVTSTPDSPAGTAMVM